MIYPVNSIIQRLNNLGLDKMCSHVKPAFNFMLISNFLCFLVLGPYHLQETKEIMSSNGSNISSFQQLYKCNTYKSSSHHTLLTKTFAIFLLVRSKYSTTIATYKATIKMSSQEFCYDTVIVRNNFNTEP